VGLPAILLLRRLVVVRWWSLVLQRSIVELGAFLLGEEVGVVHGIVVGELDWRFPLVGIVLVVTVLEPSPQDVVEFGLLVDVVQFCH